MAFKMRRAPYKKDPIRKVKTRVKTSGSEKTVTWTNPITGKTRTKHTQYDLSGKKVGKMVTTNLYGDEGNVKVKTKSKGRKSKVVYDQNLDEIKTKKREKKK